jgi:hypothetical protein
MAIEDMATGDMVTATTLVMAAATIIPAMDLLIIILGATGMAEDVGQDQDLEVGDEKVGQGGRILF